MVVVGRTREADPACRAMNMEGDFLRCECLLGPHSGIDFQFFKGEFDHIFGG